MQRGLFTWRLIPTEKDSDLWLLSTHSGEVWVRARDAVEARTLAAHRFRVPVRTNDGRSGMESPWYVRELVRCEMVRDPRFEFIEIAGVAYPQQDRFPTNESAICEPRMDAHATAASDYPKASIRDAFASEVREAIVALLLAKGVEVRGAMARRVYGR